MRGAVFAAVGALVVWGCTTGPPAAPPPTPDVPAVVTAAVSSAVAQELATSQSTAERAAWVRVGHDFLRLERASQKLALGYRLFASTDPTNARELARLEDEEQREMLQERAELLPFPPVPEAEELRLAARGMAVYVGVLRLEADHAYASKTPTAESAAFGTYTKARTRAHDGVFAALQRNGISLSEIEAP